MNFNPQVALFNAQAANGTSNWMSVSGSNHMIQYKHTGSPTGGTVTIQGSLDGSTAIPTAIDSFDIASGTSGDACIPFTSSVPYMRAVLAGLTGGTAPTVSAMLSNSE